MYSFKRVTYNEEYNHDVSGYVKYIGYEIPVMHCLSYYSDPATVSIDGTVYKCPDIRELSMRHPNGVYYRECEFSPVSGIWVEIENKMRKDTGMDSGYYGRIIVYDSTEEAIHFLEMLRDKLYSTPFYIETTKDKGFHHKSSAAKEYAMKFARQSGVPYTERDPVNKNIYYKYHVDIDELNAFIEDLRNDAVEFPVEHVTVSTATDPIKQEPITEQPPKRITWRWSV